jgi:hypothetical protein
MGIDLDTDLRQVSEKVCIASALLDRSGLYTIRDYSIGR